MKRLPAAVCAIFLAACATAPAASVAETEHAHGAAVPVEGEATLALKGAGGEAQALTEEDLDALPQASLEATIHGETHVYAGPLLADVVALAGAPVGEPMHGGALMQVVIVSARDDYQVAFALGELDPGLSPERVLLATSMDGAPLPDADGPFRIVVENAQRGARSARMVSGIEVRSLD